MTLKDLRRRTKCPIWIERVDADGAVRRTEYRGSASDWTVESVKIIHVKNEGFALCVELAEEEG